ncbi:MAG: ATP-binding cassette domain-containing protein, partial [Lachnospiraceae bacterium]|nr:ATP-binding cassette domain-containing protein [Lachnospiraceae bacterium]
VETCRDLLLDDFIHELPFGYDTLVDENGGLLSTGQRQRINIARALVRKPDILLLDEATSNLDPISEKQINTCLNALRGNTTCIVIAHKASAIRDCQRIYYMKQGNVIAAGTHAELLQTCPEYAQYAGE